MEGFVKELKRKKLEELNDMLTDVINAREAYGEGSMEKEALILDEQYVSLTNEIGEREDFIAHFDWCNRDIDVTGYGNSYITVTVFNPPDKESLADALYMSRLSNYVMFPEHSGDKAEFDIHKGSFVDVEALSCMMPDSILFTNDDWDDHTFGIYQNGSEYCDFTVEWCGDAPKPYEDAGGTYYDCDVKVKIALPDGQEKICICGGGMCTEVEHNYYASMMKTSPYQVMNGEITVDIEELRKPSIQEAIRKQAEGSRTLYVKVMDKSLYDGAYWEVTLPCFLSVGEECVSLKANPGTILFSWGFDEKGDWYVDDGNGYVEPERVRNVCKKNDTFFKQLIELSDTSYHGPFGLSPKTGNDKKKYVINCWIRAHYDMVVEASCFEDALEMAKSRRGTANCDFTGLDVYESGYTSVTDESGTERYFE